MKSFSKRILALASAAAIALTTIPAVHADQQLTAVEVKATHGQALRMVRSIPTGAPLTRQGLCNMVMNSYKSITGLTDEDLEQPNQAFIDCMDPDVLNACHLGLIQGQGAGMFDPKGTVTRQEFWTITAGLLETVGYPYLNDIEMDLDIYSDADQVADSALQPLQALLCLEILSAEEGSELSPNGTITSEEAMAMLEQVVTFYTEWLEDPVEPQRYLGEEIADFALDYVGCRYVSGGRGPNKFDCSGFVYYVYKNFGYTLKPGAKTQWSKLDGTIKKADLLPGDLVFFSRNGRSSGIFHVGLYIGDGQFVHAANSRKGVIVTDMDEAWYANRYLGAKRAIG